MSAIGGSKENDGPRFGAIAAQLAENGYEPLPVHWRRKNPSAGKDWQHYKYRDGDEHRFRQHGTGLLCGRIIGVDIDVRLPELAAELERLAEEMLGPAPRRIGQAPKVLRVYQAEKPFSKIATSGYRMQGDDPEAKAHRVEILAQGQQFVAYNIHPDTGRPYQWNGAGDPLTVPIGLLPAVDEALAREFIKRADRILAQLGHPVGRLVEADEHRQHEAAEEQRARDPSALREALEALPNENLEYDDWIRVLYATKGALGDEGLEPFLSWSAKSAKDRREFSREQFEAANPRKIGAGTIYRLAQLAGWKRLASSDSPEWPAPVDILSELSAPELRSDGIPAAIAEFPEALAAATGFDPSLTLSSALAVCAAALSDEFQLVANSKTQYFQQARLWVLNIGRPGSAKTPSQRQQLAPLWAIHHELLKRWAEAVRELPEGEAQPPKPRVILADTTVEALSEALRDNPRGLLVANDEFESWLGSLDAYRRGSVSRDRGEWLRLFDGGPHTVERVQRGSIYVPNWGVSILTATTPAALSKFTRELPEDGLLQRFLPFVSRAVRDERSIPELEQLRERYGQTVNRMYNASPRAHNGCIQLSLEAQSYFRGWLKRARVTAEAFGSVEPALEAHLAKYPTFLLRIALTFHAANVVNHGHEHARDPAAFPVPLATIEAAARFLTQARRHAIAVYLNRTGSETYQLGREIARAILARGWQTVARRELIQGVRSFRAAEQGTQDAVLRLLEDLGWLRALEGAYQKATPARYAVNPVLPQRFADIAERERQRRNAMREAIRDEAADRGADGGV